MAHHNKIGKIGEKWAAKFLESKNYSILDKNYETKYAEIDIIAKPPHENKILFWRREEKPLVFFEVKTRTGERFGSPEDNIDYKKKKKLIRNARAYVAFNNYEGAWRVDAVCIVLKENNKPERIDHYKNITGF